MGDWPIISSLANPLSRPLFASPASSGGGKQLGDASSLRSRRLPGDLSSSALGLPLPALRPENSAPSEKLKRPDELGPAASEEREAIPTPPASATRTSAPASPTSPTRGVR